MHFFDSSNNNAQFNHRNPNNSSAAAQNRVRNLIIECPSEYVNMQPSSKLNSNLQAPKSFTTKCSDNGNHVSSVGSLTPQAQAVLNLNPNGLVCGPVNNSAVNNDQTLRSLFGLQGGMTVDMMPVFAAKLKEFIETAGQSQIHKPVYDMQIQKDIHELQVFCKYMMLKIV